MESVGTDTGLMVVSIVIQLAVLLGVGYGLYRLIRASRDKTVILAILIIVGIVLLAVVGIGYAYLAALGRGMGL